MKADEITTIKLHKSTVERLKGWGAKGETYEDLILWLLNNIKLKKL